VAARLRLQTDFSIESGVSEGAMNGGLILLKHLLRARGDVRLWKISRGFRHE
jgi:hypothetical protein